MCEGVGVWGGGERLKIKRIESGVGVRGVVEFAGEPMNQI